MTAIAGMRGARLAGLVVGIALAAALLLASRPASGGEAVGAAVGFYANQTGELAVSPPGPAKFIDESALRAGHSVSGEFEVTNQTGIRGEIRLTALPSAHELDELLNVRLSARGKTLAAGALGDLASADGKPLILASGHSATVTATVSLASGAREDAAAALVDVTIGFELEAVG
jgi:hypothetical protein